MPANVAVGFVFVVVSVICGGSWGAPSKLKFVKEHNLDPIVFQFYNTLGVFISSWVMQALLPINGDLVTGGGSELQIPFLGLVSGVLFVLSVATAIMGYTKIGIALLSGISCCCTILSSWLWGVVSFGEIPSRPAYSVVGLVVLLVAVFGISFCKDLSRVSYVACCLNIILGRKGSNASSTNWTDNPMTGESFEMSSQVTLSDKLIDPSNTTRPPPFPRRNTKQTTTTNIVQMDSIDFDHSQRILSSHSDLRLMAVANFPRTATSYTTESNVNLTPVERAHKILTGVLLAALSGVAGGSGWVPLNYLPASAQGVAFLPSFAIGCLVTSAFALGLHCFVHGVPEFHVRGTFFMGLLSGIIVNICALTTVISITYLGYSLAYPLSQSSIIVSGMWGILAFREVRGPAILVFSMFCVIMFIGLILLAYGSGTVG